MYAACHIHRIARSVCPEGREWKSQTMSTFLSRLVDKGALTATRDGRTNKYTPRISPEDYKLMEAQHVLDGLYQGSVKT